MSVYTLSVYTHTHTHTHMHIFSESVCVLVCVRVLSYRGITSILFFNPPSPQVRVMLGGTENPDDDPEEEDDEDDDDWLPDSEKTPVTIVTGFLGSGTRANTRSHTRIHRARALRIYTHIHTLLRRYMDCTGGKTTLIVYVCVCVCVFVCV